MPAKLSSVSFDFNVSSPEQAEDRDGGDSVTRTVVVLGDFSGRANRGVLQPVADRRPRAIDVDNAEAVLADLKAALHLESPELPGGGLDLTIGAVQDFHPDRLVPRMAWLSRLAEARRLLLKPATAEEGKALLQACLGDVATPPATAPQSPAAGAPTESDADTMTRLLGGAPPAATPAPATSQLQELIRQAVAGQVSPATTAAQTGAVTVAEMELARRLKALLHHPAFQALEAAWLGLDRLVRRIEDPEQTRLILVDVSLAELQADAGMADALVRLLRDRRPALLVAGYTFGETTTDLQVLSNLAAVAARLSTPLIATAAPQLAGCDSFARHPDPDDWKVRLPEDVAKAWDALRRSSPAAYVALAAPRFLARQPYGKAGDAIESFPFEEQPAEPVHDAFLWGPPGFLWAQAFIDALQTGGIEPSDFVGGEAGDMPVHKYLQHGEKAVQSYAECWLTDRAIAALLSKGLLPIIPVKNQNAILLRSAQSIALPPAALPFH